MDNKNNPQDWLPKDSKKTMDALLQILPDEGRSSIQQVIDKIPTKSGMWKILVKLAGNQVKFTMGQKTRVAIVGPANVGKSTLYNQFVMGRENYNEVSPVPGTTRENKESVAALFSIIDTPGADAAGKSGEEDRIMAFAAAVSADFLVIIFDATQGIKKSEQDLFTALVALNKPHIIVLNKVDLVRHALPGIISNAAKNLGVSPEKIIPVSAKESHNLAKILYAIASEEPEIMAALGKALPQYRWQLAWKIIVSSASLSGVIALTPLPLIDFIPLLINQSSMVLGIARIYDYKINKSRARELVFTFGMGFIGRTIFYELSKLAGVPGWILSAAVAASTTVAMGFAAVNWFDKGEKLTRKRMLELSSKVSTLLIKSLKGRHNRQNLQESIAQALEHSDLDQEAGAAVLINPEVS